MCDIVGTIRNPGTGIKQECKGGKCDVTVSFIVRDDPCRTSPTSTGQDTTINAPAADTSSVIGVVTRPTPSVSQIRIVKSAEEVQGNTPPRPYSVSASKPVDDQEGVAQTSIALGHASGATEDALTQPTSRPVSRANSQHVPTEGVQEREPDTEHKPAEAVTVNQGLTPLSDTVHEAATDAEQIKSVRDRLGTSVNFLEGVMKLGEFISEVSPVWTEISIDLLSFGFRSFIPPLGSPLGY